MITFEFALPEDWDSRPVARKVQDAYRAMKEHPDWASLTEEEQNAARTQVIAAIRSEDTEKPMNFLGTLKQAGKELVGIGKPGAGVAGELAGTYGKVLTTVPRLAATLPGEVEKGRGIGRAAVEAVKEVAKGGGKMPSDVIREEYTPDPATVGPAGAFWQTLGAELVGTAGDILTNPAFSKPVAKGAEEVVATAAKPLLTRTVRNVVNDKGWLHAMERGDAPVPDWWKKMSGDEKGKFAVELFSKGRAVARTTEKRPLFVKLDEFINTPLGRGFWSRIRTGVQRDAAHTAAQATAKGQKALAARIEDDTQKYIAYWEGKRAEQAAARAALADNGTTPFTPEEALIPSEVREADRAVLPAAAPPAEAIIPSIASPEDAAVLPPAPVAPAEIAQVAADAVPVAVEPAPAVEPVVEPPAEVPPVAGEQGADAGTTVADRFATYRNEYQLDHVADTDQHLRDFHATWYAMKRLAEDGGFDWDVVGDYATDAARWANSLDEIARGPCGQPRTTPPKPRGEIRSYRSEPVAPTEESVKERARELFKTQYKQKFPGNQLNSKHARDAWSRVQEKAVSIARERLDSSYAADKAEYDRIEKATADKNAARMREWENSVHRVGEINRFVDYLFNQDAQTPSVEPVAPVESAPVPPAVETPAAQPNQKEIEETALWIRNTHPELREAGVAERIAEELSTGEIVSKDAARISRELTKHPGSIPGPVLRALTQPSAWVHALDDVWYKIAGRRLESWVFGAMEKLTPDFIKRNLVYGYGQPAEAERLFDYYQAEHARNALELNELARKFKGITKAQMSRVREHMLAGEFPDTTEGQLAREVSDRFFKVGEELVRYNLLKPAQFAKYAHKYFPRMYEVFEKDGKLNSLFGRRLDLEYANSRDPKLTDAMMQAMGEMKDTPYPIFKRMTQELHDVALQRYFTAIATTPTLSSDVATPGMVQMPKNPKLGALSGRWVHKGLADDLNSLQQVPETAESMYKLGIALFKAGKVLVNPPTIGRNIFTNIELADVFGGVPPEDVVTWMRAFQETRTQGAEYRALAAQGRLGVETTAGEVQEILDSIKVVGKPRNIYEILTGVADKMLEKPGAFYNFFEQWSKMAVYLKSIERGMSPEDAGRAAESALFNYKKVPPLIRQLRSASFRGPIGPLGVIGGSPFLTFRYKAAQQAAHAVFKRPVTMAKYGLLYATLAEYARRKLGLTKEKAASISRALYRRGQVGLLMPIVHNTMYTSEDEEKYSYLDLSYTIPVYGDLVQMAAQYDKRDAVAALSQGTGVMSSPLMSITAGLITNKEPYFGTDIYSPLDSPLPRMMKQLGFIYRTLAAPILPGGYTFERMKRAMLGQPGRTGEVESRGSAAISAAGAKMIPFEIGQYKKSMERYKKWVDMEFYTTRARIEKRGDLSREQKDAQIRAIYDNRERMKAEADEFINELGGPLPPEE